MSKILLLIIAVFAAACSHQSLSSANSKAVKPKGEVLDKSTQKGTVTNYLCKGGKEVKVVHTIRKNKKTKKRTVINLTFNDITQRLTLSVSETGKKYSNIRWHWYEKSNFNMLTNSVGHVLAEQCVKRP